MAPATTNPPKAMVIVWTHHQILVVATLLGLLLGWNIFRRTMFVPSLPLADHINPNVASLPALMSLPGIGPTRAQTIITYRREHGIAGRPAFTCPEDLTAIAGLGPVTVVRITPFLVFDRFLAPSPGEKALEGPGDSIIMPQE